MEVTLKITDGWPRTVDVDSPEFIIGRGEDCDLQLKSPLVSRHHCALTLKDGCLYVRDLESRSGTGLNDQVVVGQRQLHHGDWLWVAATPIEIGIRGDRTAVRRMIRGHGSRPGRRSGESLRSRWREIASLWR